MERVGEGSYHDGSFEAEPIEAQLSDQQTASMKSAPETRSPVDLRALEYVSDFDRNLMCPICHCPFIDPARLNCDHTFCRQCFDRALNAQTQDAKSCPSCRATATKADAAALPRFLVHMIDELVVRCPNSATGCETQMRRVDVQSHKDHYCQYTQVPCAMESCKMKVLRKHSEKKCVHKIVSCNSCNLDVTQGQLVEHEQKLCKILTTQCNSCLQDYSRCDFQQHLSECLEIDVPCAAAAVGCTHIGSRNKMPTHEARCPLKALLPTLQSMSRCIHDQGAALQILQRKYTDLETKIASMQTLLGDLSMASERAPVDLASVRPNTLASSATESPPFDSATHHLLSLHESLREELDRVTAAVSQLDARSSMMIMNESLRVKEDMVHTNAVIGSMRMQLQWLTSARLQGQRSPSSLGVGSDMGAGTSARVGNQAGVAQPVRRLSDSSEKVKL